MTLRDGPIERSESLRPQLTMNPLRDGPVERSESLRPQLTENMDAQQVFTFGQQGLYMLMLVAAPILIVVLLVGVVISVIQAATQINEATLSFVPKVVAAILTLAIAGPWMMTELVEYIQRTLMTIPSVVG
jgi:flagellar biosynthetic protein FliQ